VIDEKIPNKKIKYFFFIRKFKINNHKPKRGRILRLANLHYL
jgi:hypothetical protein